MSFPYNNVDQHAAKYGIKRTQGEPDNHLWARIEYIIEQRLEIEAETVMPRRKPIKTEIEVFTESLAAI